MRAVCEICGVADEAADGDGLLGGGGEGDLLHVCVDCMNDRRPLRMTSPETDVSE